MLLAFRNAHCVRTVEHNLALDLHFATSALLANLAISTNALTALMANTKLCLNKRRVTIAALGCIITLQRKKAAKAARQASTVQQQAQRASLVT